MILDGKLCEKKGESLDSDSGKILENKANFVIKLVTIDYWKIIIFGGYIVKCISFQMPFELP